MQEKPRAAPTPSSVDLNFKIDAARKLGGQVVVPPDLNYHLARQCFVANYQYFPQIIVYCEVFSDAAGALKFAKAWNLSPVCRAGGHDTAGYSVNNEMVIDVSRLSYVRVDAAGMRADVGAGTTFARLNAVLDYYGLHVPGGACGGVAVAGYMMGGGYGYTSQIYGMNCDHVIEAKVMLADGSIVCASRDSHPDLYWALRGGTGNNFGVLLEVTYRLFQLKEVWGFSVSWHLGSDAAGAGRVAKALQVLQTGYMGEAVPQGLGHQSTFHFTGTEPCLTSRGMYAGDALEGRRLIAPLLATEGAHLDVDRVDSYKALNEALVDGIHVAAHTRTRTDSRYVARRLEFDEWLSIATLYQRSPNTGNFIGIEGYGGAISAIAPTDTAFLHRQAVCDIFIWVYWQSEQQETESLAYLDDFRAVLAPCSNGHAYQNYPNRDNHDYRWMYWGENFARLLAVKQKYDPQTLFSFGQAVTPPADSSVAANPGVAA